jgi:cardiolipin synthase (CMP-forming)
MNMGLKIPGSEKTTIYNIPNLLSSYRILAFPVILWFALTGKQDHFAIFLVVNLLTDVADGFIARKLNMESDFGAKLDSWADNFTYILAFTGVYVFKLEEFLPNIVSFIVWMSMLFSALFFSVIKFGRFPSLHLYSWKIGGYIQGAFFIVLFSYDFITPFYYLMITWGILSALEHLSIQLIIPEMRSNVKGLYWILREEK